MRYVYILVVELFSASLFAQTTYAERLGFPKGSKVIIFHVDDAGMSSESNEGTIQAMDKGLATSCSVMMPCGWTPAYMHYLKTNPNTDAGVHLTLTSEWEGYRWEPLTGCEKAPGLCDAEGAFWPDVPAVVKNATANEVEAEIRAQIARFRQFGVEPTHMDSHMGTLFMPAFLEQYIKVGIQEKIPVMFPGGHGTMVAQLRQMSNAERQQARGLGETLWNAGLPVLDDLHPDSYGWSLPKGTANTPQNLQKMKTNRYIETLKNLQPGLTMIIMHCTVPSGNFDKISGSIDTRHGDLLAMIDPRLKAYIEKEGIILTTWREVKTRREKAK